jgi:ribosomal-protein-alanine N-acetyltransferase
MQILAIDTASPWPAVSLLAGDALFEETLPSDRRSSEALLPAIARVLAAAKARLADCTRLAVCSGPGSFTGIRIGRHRVGLSRASSVPVKAVSTLECMAEAASDEQPQGDAAQRRGSRDAAESRRGAGRGRDELVVERFARRAAPIPVAGRADSGCAISAAAAGDPLVELPSGLNGAPALRRRERPPPRWLAVARAAGAASAPRPPRTRPSAAEESIVALREPAASPYHPPGQTVRPGRDRASRRVLSRPWKREFFASELVEPHRFVRVLSRDDGAVPRIGGYLFAVSLYEEFHVNKIATDLRLRHQGYGRMLLEDALARARSMGSAAMTLEVRVSNDAARQFYRSYGFAEAYRRRNYYQDGEDAFVLILALPGGSGRG